MRITSQMLAGLLAEIEAELNARGRSLARNGYKPYLSYNSNYGGYRIDSKAPLERGGAEDFVWPRWERVSGREIWAFLQGVRAGLAAAGEKY